MTAQSIVCGSCAAEVPYGRLSCPSCGELLASVAGSRRNAASVVSRTPIADVLYEPPAAPSAAGVGSQLTLERAPRNVEAARNPEAELPWGDATTTDGAGDTFAASLDGAADAQRGTTTDVPVASWGTSLSGSATPKYMPRPAPRQRPAAPAPIEAPTLGAAPAAREPAPTPAPVAPAQRPTMPTSPPVASGPVASFAGPGAYVPPLPIPAVPAGPAAPAREYAGLGGDADGDGASRPAGRPSIVSDGDARDRLLDFTRWLSVAGSSFAAVGFLLPWGLVVIGSPDVSYFGRWGIAGPWHVVVALAVLGNLALALVENRVPVWLRTGVAGLGLGALLLGLVWPYITIAALGTGPGAVIAGIGAAALVVSGLLTLVTERHAAPPDPV